MRSSSSASSSDTIISKSSSQSSQKHIFVFSALAFPAGSSPFAKNICVKVWFEVVFEVQMFFSEFAQKGEDGTRNFCGIDGRVKSARDL